MKKNPNKAAKATQKPAKMEYAGPICHSTIWFKIGLTKDEARMLKAVAGRIFTHKQTSAQTGRVLLQAALAHFDVLLPLLLNDGAYANDEGFLTVDHHLQGLVNAQAQLIAGKESAS